MEHCGKCGDEAHEDELIYCRYCDKAYCYICGDTDFSCNECRDRQEDEYWENEDESESDDFSL